jgi:ABC-type multidrug transport system permease subunit
MAVIVPHYIIGMAMIAGLYGFFMLVEGFMKIYEKMPASVQWCYYLAVHSYSFRVFMYNEFHNIHGLHSR